jgi:uncharacterized protein DUF3168
MQSIFTAIYDRFIDTPANDFYTALSGRFYFYEAPQNVTFPYAVYYLTSRTPDYWMNGERYEIVEIQLSIFSKTSGETEVLDLCEKMEALFSDCDLTISGYTQAIKFEFQGSDLNKDIKEDVWKIDAEFKIILLN